MKEIETSSHVCCSDECMGADCACCKWKAPHLCLYGTQIYLIKRPLVILVIGSRPGTNMLPYTIIIVSQPHFTDFFFSFIPHQKGCLYCLSPYLCLLFTYWLPSCPLCRICDYFNGSLEEMVSVLLRFSECQFPALGEPCCESHPGTRLAYGFASSSGRIIRSSSHPSWAGEFGHLPLLLLTLSGSPEKYFRKS